MRTRLIKNINIFAALAPGEAVSKVKSQRLAVYAAGLSCLRPRVLSSGNIKKSDFHP